MSAIGKKLDEIFTLDQQIDRAELVVRQLKQKRQKQEDNLLRRLSIEKLDGGKGKKCTATVKTSKYPSIKDNSKFWKYVAKNKAYDLVQNRVASRAYFDRVEGGEKIPGIEIFNKTSLSIVKRK